MREEYINPFLNASLNVLKTMAQLTVKAGKPYLKKERVSFGDITGIIGMAGRSSKDPNEQIKGNMVLSFEKPCILKVVSNMLGEEYTELTEDIVDAVGELTNMICGGAKSELSQNGYAMDMAIPVIIKGKNVELRQLTSDPIIVIPFETDHGAFVVESNLTTS